jgi:predicted ATPase
LLLVNRQIVQLNPATQVQIDLHQMDRLLQSTQTHDHLILADCKQCIHSLEAAAALYRGDFLSDFYLEDSNEFEDWAQANQETYRRKALETLDTLTTIATGQKVYVKARSYAQRQLEIDNLRESAYRQLMEILARSGHRTEALRQYQVCAQILASELDTTPSQQTKDLFEHIQSEDPNLYAVKQILIESTDPVLAGVETTDIPAELSMQLASPKPHRPNHNLPVQSTPFIGRKTELAELYSLITDPQNRLITIVGPGGIGKTRLSLAVVERLLSYSIDSRKVSYNNGVYFIDLTPLNQAKQVPLVMADTLQIQMSGSENEVKGQLLEFLTDKETLFLLDNFEHLIQAGRLISEILQVAPGVDFLVTSRQRLGLHAEQLYLITGLECPNEITADPMKYDATQLFVSAASRIVPNFKLVDNDLESLKRICQLVGGMPLALELAAGWVELLPLAEIANEIESNLGFLETDLRDLPERHRSMRAVFQSTWDRLEPIERSLLKKLAVFRGGFTRDAAQQVAAGQIIPSSILGLLGGLVSKSLLQVNPSRERYQLHELLRQYALERLALSGKLKTVRTVHAEYFLGMLHQCEAKIKCGQKQKAALEEIDADFANIQTAWTWALEQDNLEMIDRSMQALFWYIRIRNRRLEGMDFFRQAESWFGSNPDRISNPIWRRIMLRRIYLDQYTWAGNLEENKKWFEEILSATKQSDNLAEMGLLLECQAQFFCDLDKRRMIQNLEEARSIYHRMGDQFSEYWLLGPIGFFYLLTGNLRKRIEFVNQQYEMAKENEDRLITADAQGVLGQIDERAGRYIQAEAKYLEVLPIFQEFRDWAHTIEYFVRLGDLAFLKGEITGARKWIEKAETLLRQTSRRTLSWNLSHIESTLGMILNFEEKYSQVEQLAYHNRGEFITFLSIRKIVYSKLGQQDFSTARVYLWKALRSALEIQATGWHVQCLPAAALLAASEDQLERATELLALSFHHPAAATGWLEKFPLVTRLRERLETELSEKVYEKAWDQGKSLDLAETVQELLNELRDED